MALNEHLKDPNKIFAGDILRLGIIPTATPIVSPLAKSINKAPVIGNSPISKIVSPQDVRIKGDATI